MILLSFFILLSGNVGIIVIDGCECFGGGGFVLRRDAFVELLEFAEGGFEGAGEEGVSILASEDSDSGADGSEALLLVPFLVAELGTRSADDGVHATVFVDNERLNRSVAETPAGDDSGCRADEIT